MCKNTVFRWLHLSDLHLVATSSDRFDRVKILWGTKGPRGEAKCMDEGGLSWYIANNPVDCIVITGDFFLRGDFSEENKSELMDFLKDLYEICSDKGDWGWQRGESMDRIFWCPGNHDLNRDAAVLRDGKVEFRKGKIENCSDGGMFSPGDHRDLLTSVTFKDVFAFWKEMAPDSEYMISMDGVSPYEVQLFRMDKDDLSLYFLSLNTALAAGQTSASGSDADDEAMGYFDQFWKAHHLHNSGEALQAYKNYHECLQSRDGVNANDEGKLCFVSKRADEAIQNYFKTKTSGIVIMFGHHPISMLSKEAQSRFNTLQLLIASRLYLHGHTHVVQAKKESLQHIGVGGLFQDPDDSYNQLSFSVGEIKQEDAKYSYSIMLLFYTPESHGDRQWAQILEPIHGELWSTDRSWRGTGRSAGSSAEQPGASTTESEIRTSIRDVIRANKNKKIRESETSDMSEIVEKKHGKIKGVGKKLSDIDSSRMEENEHE